MLQMGVAFVLTNTSYFSQMLNKAFPIITVLSVLLDNFLQKY